MRGWKGQPHELHALLAGSCRSRALEALRGRRPACRAAPCSGPATSAWSTGPARTRWRRQASAIAANKTANRAGLRGTLRGDRSAPLALVQGIDTGEEHSSAGAAGTLGAWWGRASRRKLFVRLKLRLPLVEGRCSSPDRTLVRRDCRAPTDPDRRAFGTQPNGVFLSADAEASAVYDPLEARAMFLSRSRATGNFPALSWRKPVDHEDLRRVLHRSLHLEPMGEVVAHGCNRRNGSIAKGSRRTTADPCRCGRRGGLRAQGRTRRIRRASS